MKKITLLQPSLRKDSLTAEILQYFRDMLLQNTVHEIEIVDLREIELEFCDGRDLKYYNRDIQDMYQKIKDSDILIIGFPVYHYAISGVLKNFLDIVGDSLKEKKVGVIVSTLMPDCHIAYEHFFESFEKKYNVMGLSEVPYILNSDFHSGKLGLIGKGRLQKLVKTIL